MAKRKKTSRSEERPPVTPITVFAGLFLILLGLFLGLSFATAEIALDPADAAARCATGLIGAWSSYLVLISLGTVGSFLLAGLVSAWGLLIIRRGEVLATWPQVLGGVVMSVAVATLSGAVSADPSLPGGLVAHVIGPPARMYVGAAGLVILAGGVLFLGMVMAFGRVAFELAGTAWHYGAVTAAAVGRALAALAGGLLYWLRPKVAAALVTSADRALVLVTPSPTASLEEPPSPAATAEEELVEVEAVVEEDVVEPEPGSEVSAFPEADPDFRPYGIDDVEEEEDDLACPAPEATSRAERQSGPAPRWQDVPPQPDKYNQVVVQQQRSKVDYQLPPLNLLDEPTLGEGDGQASLEKRSRVLAQTLSEFKIDGRVVQIDRGPRVTLFEMTLAPGIRLSRVINLADNIAMALKAPNIRIIAPIPGKDTIGIEIPNIAQDLVSLREVICTVNREKRKQMLPLCLAKDVAAKPVVADLAKMPHVLIAGATGSGKSVCINSIILSLLMCCKPEHVKMIMIDPKMVELSRFKGIPHLMSPVITDMKRAVAVLEWASQKMDERYEYLSMVSVNNIAKFNALGEEEISKRLEGVYAQEELDLFPKSLPCIVIIIDELADLMMVAGKDVEHHVTRLAAKSRAVGIHLILATQRPSVDVITGLIKANMPSRIAFQVASKVDSRTILDQNGAETLLGAGDMLYLPPGVSKMIRAQGVFVCDEELFRVVEFCRSQMPPEYHADLEGPVVGSGGAADISDFDELFLQAGLAILESGRGSVSLLQRKLGIGYGRASRIIDQLASVGVLGTFREGKAREIMLTSEEFMQKFGGGQGTLDFGEGAHEGFAGQLADERGPDDVHMDSDVPE